MKREMIWALLLVLFAPAAALAQCVPCMHLGGQVVCPPGITPGATSVEFVMGGIRWSDGNVSMGTDLMIFTGCPTPMPPTMAPVPPMPVPSTPAPAPATEMPAPTMQPRMTSQDQASLTQETPQGRPGAERPGQQPAPGGDAADEVKEIFTETPGGPKPAIDTGSDTLPGLDAAPETGGQPPIDDDEDAGLPDPEAGSATAPFTPSEQQRLDETKEHLDEAEWLEADAERYRELARKARKRADEYEALEDPRFDADAERQRQQAQEFEEKANGFQERADQLEQQAADTIESVTVDAAVRQAAADAEARANAAASENPIPQPRPETPPSAASAPADVEPAGERPAGQDGLSLADVAKDKAVDAALNAVVDRGSQALGAIGPRGAGGLPGASDLLKLYKLGLFAESALAKRRIYNRILIILQDIISNPRTPERKLRKAKQLFKQFQKDGVIGTAFEGLKELAT